MIYVSFIYVRLYASILQKRRSYGILGRIFDINFSFHDNRRIWLVPHEKSSSWQEFSVNAGVPQASDMCRQLDLTRELESHRRKTVEWGGKQLVHFSPGKSQLVLFDRSNITGAIDVKMHVTVLETVLQLNVLKRFRLHKL